MKPKCPKCGEQITHVIEKCKAVISYRVTIRKGNTNYEWDGCEEAENNLGFGCPKCKEFLFKSDADAKMFLKEGKLPKPKTQRKQPKPYVPQEDEYLKGIMERK